MALRSKYPTQFIIVISSWLWYIESCQDHMDKYKASCYHAKFWIRLLNALLYFKDQYFTYCLALPLEMENVYSFDVRFLKIYCLCVKYQFNHYDALSSISCKLQIRTVHPSWKTQNNEHLSFNCWVNLGITAFWYQLVEVIVKKFRRSVTHCGLNI